MTDVDLTAWMAAVDGATIIGDYHPDFDDWYLCDVALPGVTPVFVASIMPDDAVVLSPHAPPWLTDAVAERLVARVFEARARAPRNTSQKSALTTARRTLVLKGLLVDTGVRRDGQVAWVRADFTRGRSPSGAVPERRERRGRTGRRARSRASN